MDGGSRGRSARIPLARPTSDVGCERRQPGSCAREVLGGTPEWANFDAGRHLMIDTTAERKCPHCGSADVETHGGGAIYYPRQTLGCAVSRYRKIIDTRFQCRACGHEFSEVEEIEF